MRSIYEVGTSADVPLTAATARSVFGVKADTGHAIDLLALAFTLDGVTADAGSVLVELCACTFATNPPGTQSTEETGIRNTSGPRIPETFSAARAWVAANEPTVVTSLKGLEYDPYKFVADESFPLGEGYDFAVSEGFVLRCTAPAAVNVRAWARWARV
jgi:hypothetical protein